MNAARMKFNVSRRTNNTTNGQNTILGAVM